MTAREALYRDRAQAEADEEAARESAQLAKRHAKGPPQPPLSTPARPDDLRQFPNFSNDTPPLYNRSDATSKDAVRADRSRELAEEEAACERARLARRIRPEDSTLKPAPPFAMPATPTQLPRQQLTTPTQAATRQAIAQSYQDEKGLWIYPQPHTIRPPLPPLPPRATGTPVSNYREAAEFEACMEQASDTLSMEELAASTGFQQSRRAFSSR